jgi:predicted lipoprotein with Yx(FWY)xxD motif
LQIKRGVQMNRIKSVLIGFIATVTLAACASMAGGGMAPYTKVSDGMLVGSNNMTLYTFAKDTAGSGKSMCNGPCANNWPPLLVDGSPALSGDYSVITRDDGKKQLAYKGMPLYFWVKDTKPGDKTGDGFLNGAWHIVKM